MPSDKQPTNELNLFPTSIVAFGASAAPVDRLMGLQSAIGKGIDLLANLRLSRVRPAISAWLRLGVHPTTHGDVS